MLSMPSFLPHVRETVAAFVQGFAIAVLLGLAIGLVLGAHRLSGEVAEPVLVALYSIPKVTLYPVILLVFGIGMPAKVAFGAIQGIVPVSLFALNAIRNIKPVYTRTGRMLRLPPARLARDVIIPAALPEIVTGIRVGFSLTLIGTLLGEMFGAQRGLGFLLLQAMTLHNVRTIMALTLLIVIAAATVNALLLAAVERRLRERL
jgi:NitT/TauT family transport system permease protein